MLHPHLNKTLLFLCVRNNSSKILRPGLKTWLATNNERRSEHFYRAVAIFFSFLILLSLLSSWLPVLARIHSNILGILSSMTPPFPTGAPHSLSSVPAHMLTGEREIPTQDDLFSWKFSPAPLTAFYRQWAVSVRKLLVASQALLRPTGLLKNSTDKATQTHIRSHVTLLYTLYHWLRNGRIFVGFFNLWVIVYSRYLFLKALFTTCLSVLTYRSKRVE